MKKKSNFNVVNLIIIGIMIWCVSASYSYYLSGRQPVHASSYYGTNRISFFDKLWAMIVPDLAGVNAKSAIVVDTETGDMLFSKNENDKLPVASLTKLATACIIAKSGVDLNQYVTITGNDLATAGKTRLSKGVIITINDLLYLSLMRSDNIATTALVRSLGKSRSEFVLEMNQLAAELQMLDTEFADPTGLDNQNRSTARDMVKLIFCIQNHDLLRQIVSRKIYKFQPQNRDYEYTLYNTNRLLFSRWTVLGGKTGYISQAGYCLAFAADLYDDREVMAVILGASSNRNRYRDADYLLALVSQD